MNAPSVFRSGVKELTETGWWSLSEVKPPEFKFEITCKLFLLSFFFVFSAYLFDPFMFVNLLRL